MDRVLYNEQGGDPLFLKDFNYNIATGFTNKLEEYYNSISSNMIICGCNLSGSIVSEGWIMLDSELLKVEQHTRTGNFFEKITTNNTAVFKDGLTKTKSTTKRATLSASSGNLSLSSSRFNAYIQSPSQFYEKAFSDIYPTGTLINAVGTTVLYYDAFSYTIPSNWIVKDRVLTINFHYVKVSNQGTPLDSIIESSGWRLGIFKNDVLLESRYTDAWYAGDTTTNLRSGHTVQINTWQTKNALAVDYQGVRYSRYDVSIPECKPDDVIKAKLYNEDSIYNLRIGTYTILKTKYLLR